jgi:hypothetical protein
MRRHRHRSRRRIAVSAQVAVMLRSAASLYASVKSPSGSERQPSRPPVAVGKAQVVMANRRMRRRRRSWSLASLAKSRKVNAVAGQVGGKSATAADK